MIPYGMKKRQQICSCCWERRKWCLKRKIADRAAAKRERQLSKKHICEEIHGHVDGTS